MKSLSKVFKTLMLYSFVMGILCSIISNTVINKISEMPISGQQFFAYNTLRLCINGMVLVVLPLILSLFCSKKTELSGEVRLISKVIFVLCTIICMFLIISAVSGEVSAYGVMFLVTSVPTMYMAMISVVSKNRKAAYMAGTYLAIAFLCIIVSGSVKAYYESLDSVAYTTGLKIYANCRSLFTLLCPVVGYAMALGCLGNDEKMGELF